MHVSYVRKLELPAERRELLEQVQRRFKEHRCLIEVDDAYEYTRAWRFESSASPESFRVYTFPKLLGVQGSLGTWVFGMEGPNMVQAFRSNVAAYVDFARMCRATSEPLYDAKGKPSRALVYITQVIVWACDRYWDTREAFHAQQGTLLDAALHERFEELRQRVEDLKPIYGQQYPRLRDFEKLLGIAEYKRKLHW